MKQSKKDILHSAHWFSFDLYRSESPKMKNGNLTNLNCSLYLAQYGEGRKKIKNLFPIFLQFHRLQTLLSTSAKFYVNLSTLSASKHLSKVPHRRSLLLVKVRISPILAISQALDCHAVSRRVRNQLFLINIQLADAAISFFLSEILGRHQILRLKYLLIFHIFQDIREFDPGRSPL